MYNICTQHLMEVLETDKMVIYLQLLTLLRELKIFFFWLVGIFCIYNDIYLKLQSHCKNVIKNRAL
jgi:hypothetical protein